MIRGRTMKIFDTLESISGIDQTVIAVGNFDGVHKGHQEIINKAITNAEGSGIKSAVFTFSNHPRNVISGEKVLNIMYPEDKITAFEKMGVDYLFVIPFTKEISMMSPDEYVDELLIKTFRMRQVCCGFNYKFGHRAAGDTKMLMEMSLEKGFGIHVIEPFRIDGQIVSSTLIREAILEGDMKTANKYLGRNYSIEGEVVVGNKLGRTIGFPTSNLIIDSNMVTPPSGVYITYSDYEGVRYPSITNVGFRPTIGEFDKNVETHIFDFDKILYGKNIKVEFVRMIRPEKKFDDIEKLKQQTTPPTQQAKAIHRSLSV